MIIAKKSSIHRGENLTRPQKGGAAVLLEDLIVHYVTKCNSYGQEHFLSETKQASHLTHP